MHKGDTIPGLLTAIFGFAVALYTLSEDTMKFRAQSSDGVPGAGFFPVLLGFVVGILGRGPDDPRPVSEGQRTVL